MGLQAAVHLGHMPWALTKEEEEEEEVLKLWLTFAAPMSIELHLVLSLA
jgi:hypothetical protein